MGISARDGDSHDVGGGGEEAASVHLDGIADIDSLPISTSFMSSNGALPPGATPVDFSPLLGSAAASLTVSQMSNEGLASSVEGLNISQVSNEGMATSAIIDAGEITVATSPEGDFTNADGATKTPPESIAPTLPADNSSSAPTSSAGPITVGAASKPS